MSGFIVLHRKMNKWEWAQKPLTLALFIHLILNANHKDQEWQGITVKRGQIITGRKKLAENTGLSERQVRTALNHLKATKEVTITTTKKYSIISITNYNKYQDYDQQNANKRPTSDQQATTNNNDNNINKYSYECESFRLNEKDYIAFRKNCPKLNDPEYIEALDFADTAFRHSGNDNWFYRLGRILEIEQSKILARRTAPKPINGMEVQL